MGNTIKIQNKLEVMAGGKLLVPGCEPTSSNSSVSLAENLGDICTATVVDLTDALAAIPGSTVIYWSNPRRKFFVLPSGPAMDPGACGTCQFVEDWYAKLRAIGTQVDAPTFRPGQGRTVSVGEICDVFPFKGCGSRGIF